MRLRVRQNHGVLPDGAACWVQDVAGCGSRITMAKRLRLGSWHVNHALDVVDGRGRIHRLVLRRWARSGWEAEDPDYTVERETRVLALLRASPVPAPVVVAADPDGAQCDAPEILLIRLPGHPPRRADIDGDEAGGQLAEALAQIHDVNISADERLAGFRLYYDLARAAPAPWMIDTQIWQRVCDVVRQHRPRSAMTLIHRDYHPHNTLWSRGRLRAVVDWTQASWGPPALDVAHMRWNTCRRSWSARRRPVPGPLPCNDRTSAQRSAVLGPGQSARPPARRRRTRQDRRCRLPSPHGLRSRGTLGVALTSPTDRSDRPHSVDRA